LKTTVRLSSGISLALKDSELAFVQARDLRSARRETESTVFDLIILDVNLPTETASIFQRAAQDLLPAVIILTANDLETDVVPALNLGRTIISQSPSA
jgi:DNA-binding response OmpR family regulator